MREGTISKNVIVTGYFQYKSRTGTSNEFARYSSVFCSGKHVTRFENALVVFLFILSFGHFSRNCCSEETTFILVTGQEDALCSQCVMCLIVNFKNSRFPSKVSLQFIWKTRLYN